MLRAQVYNTQGENAKAVADLKQATRLQPQNTEYWGDLGWFQYLDGQIDAAIATSQKAIAMNPQATFIRYNLGLCYAVKGDGSKAQAEYTKALAQANPSETQAALKDIQDALKKHPASPTLKQAQTLLKQ